MTVHYRKQGNALIVFGNTFRVKEKIKALGGRFNGAEKNWRVPLSDDTLSRVDDLCTRAGGGLIGPEEVDTGKQEPGTRDSLDIAAFSPPKNIGSEDTEASGYSVGELLHKIGATIQHAFSEPVWVLGEIQNIAKRPSGTFFELAEGEQWGHQGSTTTAKAILWKNTESFLRDKHGEKLTDIMADGLKVRCLCRVTFYKERGQVSLSIEDIDPSYTKGALALAREKLVKELRSKGLDRANSLLDLPIFPFRVGLISAKSSRAHTDFVHQMKAGGFVGDIVFAACPMQGEGVPKGIGQAISDLVQKDVDMIVLTRGGGSQADLRWFDTKEVALAVAHAVVPVVAAIGHHDDVCVAEEVCYLRQKTPTAAAEFVLERFRRGIERVGDAAGKMATRLGRKLSIAEQLQSRLEQQFPQLAMEVIARKGQRLDQAAIRLSNRIISVIDSSQLFVQRLMSRLFVLANNQIAAHTEKLYVREKLITRKDPSPWLDAGWTQLSGESGPIRKLDNAKIGATLSARLRDGVLKLTVTDTQARNAKEIQ